VFEQDSQATTLYLPYFVAIYSEVIFLACPFWRPLLHSFCHFFMQICTLHYIT